MEQQKEKKIKNYGRSQSSSMSKSNSSLPPDLVSEILQKLSPAKSIGRSRCVSKFWSSITADPCFINSFETRSSPEPSVLLIFKTPKGLFVFLFPQNHENSSKPVVRYQMKYPKFFCFSTLQSVHGLICFQSIARAPKFDETSVIWNPTLRQCFTLPKPEKKRTIVFLGYDPIEGKHKVVCVPRGEFCDECWVLTLDSSSVEESYWRTIKTNLLHKPFRATHGKGRCINGVLYYKALDHMRNEVIVSFDVRSEKFQSITVPLETIWGSPIAYEGRLAFVNNDYGNDVIDLCILEDAEKLEWLHKSFSVPFSSYDLSWKTSFKLIGVTDDGEFTYIPSTIRKSFCILYFDPKRDSFRKVVFDGIADKKFRDSNELGLDLIYELHAFPNHIESLISLGKSVVVHKKPNPWAFDITQYDNILKNLKVQAATSKKKDDVVKSEPVKPKAVKVTRLQGRYQRREKVLFKSYSSKDLEGILGKPMEESSPAVCDITDAMETEIVSKDKVNYNYVANQSQAVTKRKRDEELIQEPKVKLKKLCKQILKKDGGGSMKLKQLRFLINEQAPSVLSEVSSRKDAIAYLKLKLERSGKFSVERKKITLVSRKK